MFKSFFRTDETYEEQVAKYGRKDALMAIAVWGIVMAIYYLMGQLFAKTNFYVGTYVNIALAILCISLVVLTKQKIMTIGFTKVNVVKSIRLGSILGIIVVIVANIMNVAEGRSLVPLQTIASNFVYYMVAISLVEEIVFRGYIQTRIYGLGIKPIVTMMLGGIFFMLMHIPFQMGLAKVGLLEYVQFNWVTLLLTFFWHILFNFLYRKYNTIYTPTIFHGFLNWANYLFS